MASIDGAPGVAGHGVAVPRYDKPCAERENPRINSRGSDLWLGAGRSPVLPIHVTLSDLCAVDNVCCNGYDSFVPMYSPLTYCSEVRGFRVYTRRLHLTSLVVPRC